MRPVELFDSRRSKNASVKRSKIRISLGKNVAGSKEMLAADLAVPERARGLAIFAQSTDQTRDSSHLQIARILLDAGLATLLPDCTKVPRLLDCTSWAREHLPDLPIGYYASNSDVVTAFNAAAEAGGSLVRGLVARGGPVLECGEVLEKVSSAVLLIVGSEDGEILSANQNAYSRIHAEKDLEVIPGAGHWFAEPGALEAVAHLSADWFLDCFRRSSSLVLKPIGE